MSPITEEQSTLLDHIRDNFMTKHDTLTHNNILTPWEYKFTEDILDKYDQYGERIFLSKKQLARLIDIGAALT